MTQWNPKKNLSQSLTQIKASSLSLFSGSVASSGLGGFGKMLSYSCSWLLLQVSLKWGKKKKGVEDERKSPFNMTWPLVVLSWLSCTRHGRSPRARSVLGNTFMTVLVLSLQRVWHYIITLLCLPPHLSTPILWSAHRASVCWYLMALESSHLGQCFPTCFMLISLPQCQPNPWELGMILPIYSFITRLLWMFWPAACLHFSKWGQISGSMPPRSWGQRLSL